MPSPVLVLFCSVSMVARLLAQAPAVEAPPQLVRVHGRLVTTEGQPVAGAALLFAAVESTVTADVLQQPQAVSDADGRYELKVTPPRVRGDADPEPVVEPTPMLLVAAKGFASVAIDVPWRSKHEAARLPAFLTGGDGAAGFVYAEATEIPELVLIPGHRSTGRVRDVDGKPLAGVRVVARDLLADGNLFGGDAGSTFVCTALTDAGGIVQLPCALATGAVLDVSLDGYYRQRLAPVSAGTPIQVTMQKGGWIQGRVLDKEGHSIAAAHVVIGYERQTGMEPRPMRTGADGSFRCNLDHAGRWRASVWRQQNEAVRRGHSAVFTGPRENFEILIDATAKEAPAQLPLRVVAKGSGKPMASFRAAASWHEYANQNPGYRDYLLGHSLQNSKPASDGTGFVRAPGEQEIANGWLRVLAAGFAPVTQQVEWKEPAAGQAPEAITVEMEVEAVVRGVLLDEASGKPVAGVVVTARPHNDSPNGWSGGEHVGVLAAATSAADGTFELRGLGAGRWDLRASDAARPRCPVVEVDLAAAEQRSGLELRLPSGAVVAGTLQGLAVGHGARAFLARLPEQTFGGGSGHYGYRGEEDAPQHLVPVGKDGTFRCEGVGLANWMLVVRLPSPPRRGGDLFLPIEPFRVRPAGVQRDFDCTLDRPGTIRGRIGFVGTDLPLDQLVVVARVVAPEADAFFMPFDTQLPGPRSFVAAAGEFELQVGPGAYRLAVVDIGTMLVVHDETKKVDVKSGGKVDADLQLDLARIELELKGPADGKPMADVERVEIRVVSKAMKDAGMQIDASDEYDRGIGIRWPVGQAVHAVVLPLGEATFLCRNTVHALRVDDNRWSNPPVGRGELVVARGSGATARCVIEVGAPPELVEPEAKDAAPADGAAAIEVVPIK